MITNIIKWLLTLVLTKWTNLLGDMLLCDILEGYEIVQELEIFKEFCEGKVSEARIVV